MILELEQDNLQEIIDQNKNSKRKQQKTKISHLS
jgi:hypothetical protein